MSIVIVLVFAVLACLGMPLAFTLGFASLAGLFMGSIDFVVMPQRMMHAIDSFPLISIPLFMVAGELMVEGGIMDRLVDFANSVVGRVHGGLAHVAVLTGALLASVSGSAVASASAIGSSMVPPLRKYYDDGYSRAVIAAAANLGPIIPPSGAMIMYALMSGGKVSVGGMFMAGVVPGLLLVLGLMGTASYISYRRGVPLTGQPFNLRNVLIQTRKAFLIFMMPILVVGGIVGGMFTPTEGAGIAVAYAALVGFFVTRKLKLSAIPAVMFRAAVGSSVVGALMAFAATTTFVFTIDLVPVRLANFLQSLTNSPSVFLFLMMLILVVAGMFIESIAAYIMLVPIFAPIAAAYGIDPLWFGFLFVLNLVIGMMTPPVGVLLFAMCGITRVSIGDMIRNSWPYIFLQYGMLVLCIFFPSLCLWLPRALGY